MKFVTYSIAVIIVAIFVDATPPLPERNLEKKLRAGLGKNRDGEGGGGKEFGRLSKEDKEAYRQEICLDAEVDCALVLSEQNCTKPDRDGEKPLFPLKGKGKWKDRNGSKLGCHCCADDGENPEGPFSEKRNAMCLEKDFNCTEVLAENDCTKPDEWDSEKPSKAEWDSEKPSKDVRVDALKERMGDKIGCFCCADRDAGDELSFGAVVASQQKSAYQSSSASNYHHALAKTNFAVFFVAITGGFWLTMSV